MNKPLLDATHDVARKSWIDSANQPGHDFPIQNLPFGVFRRRGSEEAFRGGVAIGDEIVDLAALSDAQVFKGEAGIALLAARQDSLNALMALSPAHWQALRRALSDALADGAAHRSAVQPSLVSQRDCAMKLPAFIADYTDFYSSIYHATAVGRLMRPDNPLLPNYKWVPIGYHGRASSIAISGTDFHRPRGQRLPPGQSQPIVTPSVRLDYELELGVFIGQGNSPGVSIPLSQAPDHIFGMCVLNDWSARDLQAWEYQPLGPFLAKNFATTISPWIVTSLALAPFHVAFARADRGTPLLDYLDDPENNSSGALDIQVEAALQSAAMRARGAAPQAISRTSFRHSFWTVGQLVTHHTVNGCNLRPGDLLGTGTISGPSPEEAGSMLELSAGGSKPLSVGQGESRTFVEDGDSVVLRAWCEKPGFARIGFGTAAATVLPPYAPA